MATTGGNQNPNLNDDARAKLPPVLAELRDAPGEFDFFQAVRLLQLDSADDGIVGRFSRPDAEVVRFHANSDLAFPPAEIKALDDAREQAGMTVNFMGLTGPSGVLPYSYSELVLQRLRSKDRTLAEFYDLFNHRMISLFYQAWEKYRFGVVFEREGKDRLARYLLALIGLGIDDLHNRQQVTDNSLLFYAGLLAVQPRSVQALEALIGDYFNVPVTVVDFVGSWQYLSPEERTCVEDFEAFGAQLGRTALIGDAVWDEQSKIRVKLGPLTRHRYLDFLPDGKEWRPLRAVVDFFCNRETEVELQLILQGDDVVFCELDDRSEAGPRLGWFTWLKSGSSFDRNPSDTILQLL